MTKKHLIPLPALVSESKISSNALMVIHKLNKAGYKAYLVGGGVRDMLLGLKPKDFDIATNAKPEQVKAVFRNCRLIGRRFRLAHILFGREIIEVATFRGHHDEGDSASSFSSKNQRIDYRQLKGHTQDGRIVRDNVYGSIEEDAVRRDFTVNALYLDIQNNGLIDYVNGLNDVDKKLLKVIGEPSIRYHEDPVRMLRAVRFAAKLDFTIEQQTAAQIFKLSHLLAGIPAARLIDESIKLFQGGYGLKCFDLLQQYDLFKMLFPSVAELLEAKNSKQVFSMINQALENTDQRIAIGKSVNPAFFLAVLLWYPMQKLKQVYLQKGSEMEASQKAATEVLRKQQAFTSIPKRFSFMIKDIWYMQWFMQKPSRKKAAWILHHKRFRAAYDFLQLRVKVGETQYQEIYQWWTDIQELNEQQQELKISELAAPMKRKKRVKSKQYAE
ncbi:MAG: polynucleotide adenylyltransferase PcnB [Pseudomonadota bacterium]